MFRLYHHGGRFLQNDKQYTDNNSFGFTASRIVYETFSKMGHKSERNEVYIDSVNYLDKKNINIYIAVARIL